VLLFTGSRGFTLNLSETPATREQFRKDGRSQKKTRRYLDGNARFCYTLIEV